MRLSREMGWCHLNEDSGDDWNEEADPLLAESADEGDEDSAINLINGCAEFRATRALPRGVFPNDLDRSPLRGNSALQNDPAAVKLATHTALASAKLAAALSDEEAEELGMTIAYLKRSLKAITVAMDAAAQLIAEKSISRVQHAALQQRLFQVRDGIIWLMGEYRGEWLRRYSGSLPGS